MGGSAFENGKTITATTTTAAATTTTTTTATKNDNQSLIAFNVRQCLVCILSILVICCSCDSLTCCDMPVGKICSILC